APVEAPAPAPVEAPEPAAPDPIAAPAPTAEATPSRDLNERPPPTPRALETLYQLRDDEVARVSNAKGNFTFEPGLQVRNQIRYETPFEIDRFGNEYDDPAYATGRIRWSPVFGFGRKQALSISAQLDLA